MRDTAEHWPRRLRAGAHRVRRVVLHPRVRRHSSLAVAWGVPSLSALLLAWCLSNGCEVLWIASGGSVRVGVRPGEPAALSVVIGRRAPEPMGDGPF